MIYMDTGGSMRPNNLGTILITGGLCLIFFFPCNLFAGEGPDAGALVEKAFNHLRGKTSRSEFTMIIHRPDFERSMTLSAWTRGKSDAIFFVEKPPKDAGNGTLKKGKDMWSYNPKINRAIKLPPSMMSQSWMGSDFSNDDLSKTESILDEYSHRVISRGKAGGIQTYDIELIPFEDAPVVWGKQEITLREDGVLLRQAFFDEDMVLIKEMTAHEIKMMGGRLYPSVWIMKRVDEKNRYTRLVYTKLAFDVPLKPRLFTLSNLKNRRR